jgi:hypothetical protein
LRAAGDGGGWTARAGGGSLNAVTDARPGGTDMAKNTPEQVALNRIRKAERTGANELDLSGLEFKLLPTEIGQLRNLTALNISFNKLKKLPIEIGKLAKLTTLDVSDNQLSSLPTDIGDLRSLTSMRLGENQLTSLPIEIGKLTNLKILDFSDNLLSSLPVEIGKLRKLMVLDLFENQLTLLPAEIGIISNLRELYVGFNQITMLPMEIGKLAKLRVLSIFGNRLRSLPPEIGKLAKLTTLYLHGNQLKSLPAEIGNLTNLKVLYLSQNQLRSLPPKIYYLKKLKELETAGNQIADVLNPVERDENPIAVFQPKGVSNKHGVRDLFDRVQESQQRAMNYGIERQIPGKIRERLQAFISYSHMDEKLKKRLDKHLAIFRRKDTLITWNDRRIEAGEERDPAINKALDESDIILLLISADFIDSEYCYSREMKRAIERHTTNQARVIPIILKPCLWNDTPISQLIALPKDGKAVTEWKNRESAWSSVTAEIQRVVEMLQVRRRE